ncbi:hypothetical protein NFI96_006486, partial [Prochilodus magdalenae]
SEKGRCVASEYFTEPEIEITTENTANILKMVRTATPFPMVSLLFVFTAFIISNVGHIRPQRTILAFVSGIFFILSGAGLQSILLSWTLTYQSCDITRLLQTFEIQWGDTTEQSFISGHRTGPTGRCSTGRCSTGRCPTGRWPTGRWPTGRCPTGRWPTGRCPTGVLPHRTLAHRTLPHRTLPHRTLPHRSAAPQDAGPQDAAPQDAGPQDTAPQECCPTGHCPQDTNHDPQSSGDTEVSSSTALTRMKQEAR